jgi:hypothetical protein
VSLLEVVLTTFILSIVGALSVSALTTGNRTVGHVEDEHRGLADLKIVGERMSRDMRAARSVDPASTPSSLSIWIDYDSDYRQTAAETVTWAIAASSRPYQYNVTRTTGGGAAQIVGTTLLSDIVFGYAPAPPGTRVVNAALSYDAIPGLYSSDKLVRFDVRLRNVQ